VSGGLQHAEGFPIKAAVTSLPNARSDVARFAFGAVACPLFGAVNAIEPDTFRMIVVQDFDRVTIQHADDVSACDFYFT
jgi:hypothetical protein